MPVPRRRRRRTRAIAPRRQERHERRARANPRRDHRRAQCHVLRVCERRKFQVPPRIASMWQRAHFTPHNARVLRAVRSVREPLDAGCGDARPVRLRIHAARSRWMQWPLRRRRRERPHRRHGNAVGPLDLDLDPDLDPDRDRERDPRPLDRLPPTPPPPLPELPLGGREIFPTYRLVGYCGTPGAPALGPLAYNLPAKAKSLKAYADKYPDDRKPLLVFELIVVVVQSYQGADGKYRRRVDSSVVDEYLAAARKSKALLLLNIQPGQSDFMTEIKRFETYLREPDVGVALESGMGGEGKAEAGGLLRADHGRDDQRGRRVSASIVKEGNLPEKALVFHQLNRYVVKDESVVCRHPGS